MIRTCLGLAALSFLPACAATKAEEPPQIAPDPYEMTIDYLAWSELLFGADHPGLVAHVREGQEFPTLDDFTANADPVFFLVAKDHSATARCATGSVTSTEHGRFIVLNMNRGLRTGKEYTLQARNKNEEYRWRVEEGVRISR